MKFVYTCAATAVLSAIAQTASAEESNPAQVLDAISVTASPVSPTTSVLDTRDLPAARDTADILRDIPGVSGSRIGGHGTDPAIRGLSQNRINVLLDGAYVHGGCPNRMDPPTAYAPVSSYEEITVIKGVRTLEYGGGGAGGTILFTRETPRFTADEKVRARMEAGYRENGDAWDVAVDAATGTDKVFARFIGSHMEADDYEDGDGDEVRSGFEESNGTIILGYTPDDDTRLELSYEQQRTDDLLYAGAGMDSPKSDNDTYRFKYRVENIEGMLDSFRLEAYQSEVDHVMDNYTLRPPPPPMGPMGMRMLMRAPSTSDTTGGRLILELDSNIGHWKLGFDVQDNDRDAVRINDWNNMLQSVLWPGVSIDQRGLFAELEHELNSSNRIIGGLRYDHVASDASKADIDPPGMPATSLSPNDLYTIYYGTTAQKRTENNVGGLLRLEHDLENGMGMIFGGFSRSIRTADATERFLASNGMGMDSTQVTERRWVGNPLLDPEEHHQFELGTVLRGRDWDMDVSVYYNDVNDYILRDRFHSAPATGGNATIYRNVDATLYGGEANLNYRWSSNWSSNFGVAYVHAENDTDDRPIAQIPPLEGVATLDYASMNWAAGVRVRAADKQTRVDDDKDTGSGLDADKTPGWAVVDIYGTYSVTDAVDVDFGVDNLFDKEYAQHLNRASAFDLTPADPEPVNEPGMSAWLKLRAEF